MRGAVLEKVLNPVTDNRRKRDDEDQETNWKSDPSQRLRTDQQKRLGQQERQKGKGQQGELILDDGLPARTASKTVEGEDRKADRQRNKRQDTLGFGGQLQSAFLDPD